LTENLDIDPKEALLEFAFETERWDPVPGTKGHKIFTMPSGDEDDEGRTDGEKFVEEGPAEAKHDQMLQATKAQRATRRPL